MPPIRVAIITGCVVPRDAVSNITLQQADALGRPARVGGPRADVRIYCHGSPLIDSRLRIIPDATALAADSFFGSADLIIFHYAIRYPAFDAIHVATRTARVLAYYHGITPPSVCGPADRAITAESYRQANHLLAADTVLTTSRHLAGELLGYGVTADRTAVVPPAVSFAPSSRPPYAGPPRFLYVGRFVRPKGVADLLEAFRLFAPSHPGTTLDLAGSTIFSDAGYLAGLRAAADSPELRGRVTFDLDLPADRLAERFARADVFVLPSYHEGFGVPIVEALTAGCYVVCSDAGASPETAGGLGLTFRAGDVLDLCGCLERVAAAWAAGERPTAAALLPAVEWHRRAAEYAATFDRSAFEDRFRAAVFGGVRRLPAGLREYFTEARDRALGGVTAVPSVTDDVYEKFRRLAG
jgi:glycosyltransferase involved in cell wall biosynthesis